MREGNAGGSVLGCKVRCAAPADPVDSGNKGRSCRSFQGNPNCAVVLEPSCVMPQNTRWLISSQHSTRIGNGFSFVCARVDE